MTPRTAFAQALAARRVVARYLAKQGMEFDTPREMEQYLKDHPDADKSKHSVKSDADRLKEYGERRDKEDADKKVKETEEKEKAAEFKGFKDDLEADLDALKYDSKGKSEGEKGKMIERLKDSVEALLTQVGSKHPKHFAIQRAMVQIKPLDEKDKLYKYDEEERGKAITRLLSLVRPLKHDK